MDRKPFQCDECGKELGTGHQIKNHIVKHHGKKPYQCNECAESFVAKMELKEHNKAKDEWNNLLQARSLNEQFTNFYQSEGQVQCNGKCDNSDDSNQTGNSGINSTKGMVKISHCNESSKDAKSSHTLSALDSTTSNNKEHEKETESEGNDDKFLCDGISKRTLENSENQCEICNVKFTSTETLEDHMLLHRRQQAHVKQETMNVSEHITASLKWISKGPFTPCVCVCDIFL